MDSRPRQSGFTLLEIIIVISIAVVVYAVALPQLRIITGTEAAERLGTMSEDIRAAYDMAVLTGKPHRLVFMLESGEYWLEEADRRDVYVGDQKISREPTEEEDKDQLEAFEQSFDEYKNLSGEEFKDSDTEKVIKPFSPVLKAKKNLTPAKWTKIENIEWQKRSIGPSMIFKSFKAEHHAEKQTFEALGEKARGMLYFFPQGYIEQCNLVITMRSGKRDFDESSGIYTVTCNSYEGTAEVDAGEKEVEFKEREDA